MYFLSPESVTLRVAQPRDSRDDRRCRLARTINNFATQGPGWTALQHQKMPLWPKKHKKDSKSQEVDTNDPPLQIFRSDTLGIEPLRIPSNDSPTSEKPGRNTPSPSPVSPKPSRLSRLGLHHRSVSQNSLPEWTPPDESDPNAERDWEARATKLAKLRPTSMQASHDELADLAKLSVRESPVPSEGPQSPIGQGSNQGAGWLSLNTVDGMTSDDALQEAIRLHEAGGILYFKH
jgi:hypothetical protein